MIYTQDMGKDKSPKQRTPKGHEIPVPKREDFLRDVEEVAKAKPSTARRAKK